MPDPNALVARVLALPEAAEAPTSKREPIQFEGGREAVLPPGRRAEAWRGMLEHTRQYAIPAYVEVDPETAVITRVLIPTRATVVDLEPTADGDVGVRMVESHTGHKLLRSNPDFQDMLNALEAARVSGEAVLVTSTRDEHEIIDVREAPEPPATGDPPDDPPPSVVTEAQAIQLFNDMAATTCNPATVPPGCIPFMFPDDGCYARAHEMARLMRLGGIEAEKVWIYASSNSNLNPDAANHPDCEVNWWYHVAPTLQVQTGSGIEKRVIDPSLMTGPVTPDVWRTRQNDAAATFEFTDAIPFWPKPNYTPDDANYTLTNQYLAEKRSYLQDRTADFGAPPYACPIVKKAAFILDRSTFGQDEVTAMLQGANPAVIEAAIYVVLDGFKPQEVGITNSTPTDPPTLKPTLTVNPLPAQMEIRAAHLDLEDPAHLNRRQRITWTYEVRFVGITGFNFGTPTLNVALGATISGESATASIQLIKQPNPFEIDGPTHWLSTDLRVFQINANQPKFNATMGASAAQAPAFIQQIINNLNTGNTGGQTFDNALSTDQQTSKLELSEAVNGTKVFNFAVARVRYIGTLQAQDVRCFFRLFPASTTSLAFDTSTTYRSGGQGGVKVPLLGIQGSQLVTIPCFASSRVDSATAQLTTQTDAPNVQPIAASATERQVFFGAWLDINQSGSPQFPLIPSPADGPFGSGRKSVYELVRSAHQCLVAEIAFDPAPVPSGVTPGTSDKLAQRNLAIVELANPGVVGSRRIPQTFEVKATVDDLPEDEPHDELMIDWGRTPVGSTARIYLPEADAEEILDLAAAMYRTSNLALLDEHTVKTTTGGMSWIPIPKGTGNLTGLLTIDLPPTVRVGQAFTIVARQVTGRVTPVPVIGEAAILVAKPSGRRILGSFQITIPVRAKEVLLAPQQRLLSNLRFIEQAIPPTDRWFPAFHRYVAQMASRVDGLGGNSDVVGPSPTGDWETGAAQTLLCRALELASIALVAMFFVTLAASGLARIVLAIIDLGLLALVGYVWVTTCRPSTGRSLLALLIGVVVGLVILAVLGIGP